MGWFDNLGNAARHVSAAWTHEAPELDVAAFDAALRACYTPKLIGDLVYRDSSWLTVVGQIGRRPHRMWKYYDEDRRYTEKQLQDIIAKVKHAMHVTSAE